MENDWELQMVHKCEICTVNALQLWTWRTQHAVLHYLVSMMHCFHLFHNIDKILNAIMQSITIDSLIIASSNIVDQTLVETVVAFALSNFQPQDLLLSG